jgi:hypothetical protein
VDVGGTPRIPVGHSGAKLQNSVSGAPSGVPAASTSRRSPLSLFLPNGRLPRSPLRLELLGRETFGGLEAGEAAVLYLKANLAQPDSETPDDLVDQVVRRHVLQQRTRPFAVTLTIACSDSSGHLRERLVDEEDNRTAGRDRGCASASRAKVRPIAACLPLRLRGLGAHTLRAHVRANFVRKCQNSKASKAALQAVPTDIYTPAETQQNPAGLRSKHSELVQGRAVTRPRALGASTLRPDGRWSPASRVVAR